MALPLAVDDGRVSRAEGLMLGVCAGDALGAPLEHLGRAPRASDVRRAMERGGFAVPRRGGSGAQKPPPSSSSAGTSAVVEGSTLTLAPGQVTDDGELAISGARGCLAALCEALLASSRGEETPPGALGEEAGETGEEQGEEERTVCVSPDTDTDAVLDAGFALLDRHPELLESAALGDDARVPSLFRVREWIAHEYGRWACSEPPDMGFTSLNTLGVAMRAQKNAPVQNHIKSIGLAQAMEDAARYGETLLSKSNGSLMRISHLAILGWRLPDERLAALARADSALSHANDVPSDACAAYCICAAELIRSGDVDGALNRMQRWAENNACSDIQEWIAHSLSEDSLHLGEDITRDPDFVPFHPGGGFVRVAFCHAIRFLRLGVSYEDGIARVLHGGGDTDTNAAICGGLLGARYGVSGLPAGILSTSLHCNTSFGKHPRTGAFHPRQLVEQQHRHDDVRNSSPLVTPRSERAKEEPVADEPGSPNGNRGIVETLLRLAPRDLVVGDP
jgi:ADP-ribosylglycohydrolase